MGKIDLVVTWVDGTDPAWQDSCRKIAGDVELPKHLYRDWGWMQYWFRGVEKNLPWIDHIFFVTWGHLPPWLNPSHPKIRIIRHEDFIPQEYLPTFSSHTIEWNLHRIEDLSEQFILCNDDMFFLGPIGESDYFQNGLPCDILHICPVTESRAITFNHLLLNNMVCLNRHFDLQSCARAYPDLWFSEVYGEAVRRDNKSALRWTRFPGLYYDHMPVPLLKSTIEKLWQLEGPFLDQICHRRFRDFYRDINVFLVKFWNLAEGRFVPYNRPHGKYCLVSAPDTQLAQTLNGGDSLVCLNEAGYDMDFPAKRKYILAQLELLFPEPSSFERS